MANRKIIAYLLLGASGIFAAGFALGRLTVHPETVRVSVPIPVHHTDTVTVHDIDTVIVSRPETVIVHETDFVIDTIIENETQFPFVWRVALLKETLSIDLMRRGERQIESSLYDTDGADFVMERDTATWDFRVQLIKRHRPPMLYIGYPTVSLSMYIGRYPFMVQYDWRSGRMGLSYAIELGGLSWTNIRNWLHR